jgi:hypothetical protein
MEWASVPVFSVIKGQKRKVTRGQSYYAGDGINKALTKPEAVEAILDQVLALGNAPAVAAERTVEEYETRARPGRATRLQARLAALGADARRCAAGRRRGALPRRRSAG